MVLSYHRKLAKWASFYLINFPFRSYSEKEKKNLISFETIYVWNEMSRQSLYFFFYKNANQLKAAVIWTLFERVSRILNSSRTVRFMENNRPNSLSSKQNKVILNIANDK